MSAIEPRDKHVVILGAGPAGLATGHELALNDVRVTVLEKNNFVGGLCRTVHEGGYKFDLGGHRWFTKNEHLNNWFRRLMRDEIVMVERISRIYYNGLYYTYPVEIGDVVRKAGLFTIARAGLTFVSAAIRYGVLNRPIKNIEDAYIAQFGSTLYSMFFEQYTEKLWGLPCHELSADWVSQRSRGLNIWTIVQEALAARQAAKKSLVEEFMYPRDGYVRIPERMAEDINAKGNEVLLQSAVKSVRYNGPNDLEIGYDSPTGPRTVRATDVVSTIPLGLLAQIIEPKADPDLIAAARSLTFRDLVTVNVKLRRKQVSRDTWLYVQDRAILFGRLHEPKNWSKAMVPDDEHTSLVLECFCTAGDAIWSMTDQAIADRCVADLAEKLKFVKPDEVIGWNVVRTYHAYPVYDLTYEGKIERIKKWLNTMPGIHIVGRGGTFRYNNADHSVEMGLLLGRRILGDEVDHMAVNTEQEYQEEIQSDEIGRDHFKMPQKISKSGSVA
jgi:protoporphyrinogen oxidase